MSGELPYRSSSELKRLLLAALAELAEERERNSHLLAALTRLRERSGP